MDLGLFGSYVFGSKFQLGQSVERTIHLPNILNASGCLIGQHNPEVFVLLTRGNLLLLAYPPVLPSEVPQVPAHTIYETSYTRCNRRAISPERHQRDPSHPPPTCPHTLTAWIKREPPDCKTLYSSALFARGSAS